VSDQTYPTDACWVSTRRVKPQVVSMIRYDGHNATAVQRFLGLSEDDTDWLTAGVDGQLVRVGFQLYRDEYGDVCAMSPRAYRDHTEEVTEN
jgi:hypothetical protein